MKLNLHLDNPIFRNLWSPTMFQLTTQLTQSLRDELTNKLYVKSKSFPTIVLAFL